MRYAASTAFRAAAERVRYMEPRSRDPTDGVTGNRALRRSTARQQFSR